MFTNIIQILGQRVEELLNVKVFKIDLEIVVHIIGSIKYKESTIFSIKNCTLMLVKYLSRI